MMGVALILIKVKSPMLFSVGMYLPLETTFAIFVGGLIKWVVTLMSERRKHNAAQKARVENTGVLVASGLIAGEALVGLIIAGVIAATADHRVPVLESFQGVAPWLALAVFAVLAAYLILVPLKKAAARTSRPPPTAGM
jgi:Na+-translocating ferredoxin:NAD+ oxidoreductase RnfA subunit